MSHLSAAVSMKSLLQSPTGDDDAKKRRSFGDDTSPFESNKRSRRKLKCSSDKDVQCAEAIMEMASWQEILPAKSLHEDITVSAEDISADHKYSNDYARRGLFKLSSVEFITEQCNQLEMDWCNNDCELSEFSNCSHYSNFSVNSQVFMPVESVSSHGISTCNHLDAVPDQPVNRRRELPNNFPHSLQNNKDTEQFGRICDEWYRAENCQQPDTNYAPEGQQIIAACNTKDYSWLY